MDTSNITTILFEICILPILGILTKWLIAFIQKKIAEASAKTDSIIAQKYYQMLADVVTECVQATNQTYVETLKQEGKFDLEAQKNAFKMTKNAVLNILGQDVIEFLISAVQDFDLFVDQQIEATVNTYKKFN